MYVCRCADILVTNSLELNDSRPIIPPTLAHQIKYKAMRVVRIEYTERKVPTRHIPLIPSMVKPSREPSDVSDKCAGESPAAAPQSFRGEVRRGHEWPSKTGSSSGSRGQGLPQTVALPSGPPSPEHRRGDASAVSCPTVQCPPVAAVQLSTIRAGRVHI